MSKIDELLSGFDSETLEDAAQVSQRINSMLDDMYNQLRETGGKLKEGPEALASFNKEWGEIVARVQLELGSMNVQTLIVKDIKAVHKALHAMRPQMAELAYVMSILKPTERGNKQVAGISGFEAMRASIIQFVAEYTKVVLMSCAMTAMAKEAGSPEQFIPAELKDGALDVDAIKGANPVAAESEDAGRKALSKHILDIIRLHGTGSKGNA